jgi:hypothetical protein
MYRIQSHVPYLGTLAPVALCGVVIRRGKLQGLDEAQRMVSISAMLETASA